MLGALAVALGLACPPLPGVESLWADEKVRTIIFGEVHGTVEAPALFAGVVCHAAQRGPVTVALEQSETISREIDTYVRTGTPAAREALLATPDWRSKLQDGRTSDAMLELLDRLHALRAAGAEIAVIAVLPGQASAAQNYHEILMAAGWARAARSAPHLVLGLVGNLHARKLDASLPQRPLRPAAAHLPPVETLTLNIVHGGGAAWNCRAQDGCKARQAPPRPVPPRGLILRPTDDGAYDGIASTGAPATASPPAARSALEAPE